MRPASNTTRRWVLLVVAIAFASVFIGVWIGRGGNPAPQPHGPELPLPADPGPAPPPTTRPAAPDPDAPLQIGDQVEMRVIDGTGRPRSDPRPLAVDPQGMISVPGVGAVRARGLTPSQLEKAITESLKVRNLSPDGTIGINRVGADPSRL